MTRDVRVLGRHELHRRALHGFGNRFGIVEVVLLSLAIGANIFGRHQPGIVTKRCEFAAQVMRTDAGFPCRSGKGGMLTSRASTCPRHHFCRSTMAPRASWPTTWNEFLQISMPITAPLYWLSETWCSSSLAPLPSILSLVGREHGRTIPLTDSGCCARNYAAGSLLAPSESR
jgi:hypothetical protein